MIFLPYKMDARKRGIPLFTGVICLLCMLVFWKQLQNDQHYFDALAQFCAKGLDRSDWIVLKNLSGVTPGRHCPGVFLGIRESGAPDTAIATLIDKSPDLGIFRDSKDDWNYQYGHLLEIYQRFERQVPASLTDTLAYDPKNPDLWTMVSSTFSHGSLEHLMGNLLFFYIFAASVELVLGYLRFALFILTSIVVTSLAYTYATLGVEVALPTIGLSGVVMANVVALAIMLPQARIRCFFWFLLIIRIFHIPAIVIALWFVGWDLYEMRHQGGESMTNYVAHVSGAGWGALTGILMRLLSSARVRAASK